MAAQLADLALAGDHHQSLGVFAGAIGQVGAQTRSAGQRRGGCGAHSHGLTDRCCRGAALHPGHIGCHDLLQLPGGSQLAHLRGVQCVELVNTQ